MFDELSRTTAEYGNYYCHSLWMAWKHIGPVEYVGLLIIVLVVGWLFMKNSTR